VSNVSVPSLARSGAGRGIAELTNPDTLDVLIARADAALYADRRDARCPAAADTTRFKRVALRPSGR